MIKIVKPFATFMHTGRGMRFKRIVKHIVQIVNYNPLRGGGRITLDRGFSTGVPIVSCRTFIDTPNKEN